MDDLELLRRLRADVPPPSPTAKAAARRRLDAMIEAAEVEHEDVVTSTDEVHDMTQTQLPSRPATDQSSAPPKRRWLGVAAAIAALAVAGAAIFAIVSDRQDTTPIVNEPDGGPAPGVPGSDVTSAGVGAFPEHLVFADGVLWVANHGSSTSETSLMRVDPETMEIAATLTPPEGTRFICGLTVGDEGSVLITTCGEGDQDVVARVTATDGFEVLYEAGGVVPVAAELAGGSLWVFAGEEEANAELRRVDPATGEAQTIDVGAVSPRGTTVAFGSLWVTSHAQAEPRTPRTAEVVRIDLASGQVTARIPVGDDAPSDITATAEGIYVAIPDTHAVTRIDPASDSVTAEATVSEGLVVDRMPVLGAAADALWARLADGSIVELALGSLGVGTPIALDPPAQFPGAITVSEDHVFVARQVLEGQLHRLER